MNSDIALVPYAPGHRPALEDIIRRTWHYDRFCSPNTARAMARVYLASALAGQTFTRVAVVDGVPAGIIAARHVPSHRPTLRQRLHLAVSTARLLLRREGRAVSAMFGGIQQLDRQLLARQGTDYQGELAFFALGEQYRGLGLGRRLFQTAEDYFRRLGAPSFYLFTDTSCNYPFYEHMGLLRRQEETMSVPVNGREEQMTFFLYEGAVSPN